MSVETLAVILFIASAVMFILGLRMLGRPETARRGNLVSACGMGAAVAGTLAVILGARDVSLVPDAGAGEMNPMLFVALGLLIGGAIGVPAARLVKMTAMPEMVALFNGFGGIASLLVGWGTLHRAIESAGAMKAAADPASTIDPPIIGVSVLEVLGSIGGGDGRFVAATVFLAVLIGGVTFTGSIVAFGKLAGRITSKPVLYPGQNWVNGSMAALALAGGVALCVDPGAYWVFIAVMALSFVLGVAVVIPIGGGDMPVVISLLNSYSGLAACAAGFATGNMLLIVVGALVGASGIILTRIMCLAMNRSLANVLFSGFGAAPAAGAGPTQGERREARSLSPEEAYYVLEAASSVIFVPGYGMAVAQAQHAVKELGDLLEKNGAEVRYAVHPVAGRMPGHMNVLLAEANVAYEQLAELDDVNPSMETVDVAVVIGANDVVNPDAKNEASSPLYGMPIVEVDRARNVFVLKRSLASGYAGVENPLFFLENASMVFGDAKKTIEAVVGEFKASS